MKYLTLCIIFTTIIPFQNFISAQSSITKDIKSFGAKGDGKTNDQLAFQSAATYFNSRGGNGTLTISKGIYIIGKQTFTGGKPNKPAYEGGDVLHFTNVKNFKLTGTANSILKYADSLRFGTFAPNTGKRSENGNNFHDVSYAGIIGICVAFDQCNNVSVTNLTMDGNNKSIITGGVFGDVGRQLPHYGIFIKNSSNVVVNNVNAHNFGLDGICVSNIAGTQKDSIQILNSSFQYNSRQGLSWVGGNNLVVKNCKFNNTGGQSFSSPPSAGVDIEAEVGPVRNGYFTACEFTNNAGPGVLAESGDDADCTFTNCTFWGISNWSIWITKPGFTFNNCNVYGSPSHGYDSPDDKNATKFNGCTFEDNPYMGKEPYGNYLIESNNAKRVSFADCKFIANKKKLCWITTDPKTTPEEKYQFTNCSFVIKSADYPVNSFVGLMRGMALKNCTFQFTQPGAKNKQYFFEGYTKGNNTNVDLGGNKIIYSAQ